MFQQKLLDNLNQSHEVKIQPIALRLSSKNQMPIQIEGTAAVPIQVGPKKYEHTFYDLIEAT